MSNYLEITPHGLKHYELDHKKLIQFKTLKTLKSYKIINQKGEEIFDGTESETDNFYYIETPVGGIWSKLRSTCKINSDATIGDVYRIIDDDPNLAFIIKCFFPFHDTMTICSDEKSPETISINKVIEINHNVLNWSISTDDIISPDNSESKLIVNEETPVFLNGKQVGSGKYSWTLLEILSALFGAGAPREPIEIKKDHFKIQGLTPTESTMPWIMGNTTIDPDVTLQDIFNLVKKDDLLKTFLTEYSWCEAIDEIHASAQHLTPSKFIKQLQIADRASLNDNYLNIGPEINGVDDHSEIHSISATPVSHIAHLPVQLTTSSIFIDILGRKIPYTRQFSLLEILDSIYWETSFYGVPTDSLIVDSNIKDIQHIKETLDETER